MFCISWEKSGHSWLILVVFSGPLSYCEDPSSELIFLHLFWAKVLRLCHGLGIRSCQNICLSRHQATIPPTYFFFSSTFPAHPALCISHFTGWVGCLKLDVSFLSVNYRTCNWRSLLAFPVTFSLRRQDPIYQKILSPFFTVSCFVIFSEGCILLGC